ncbi:hypothetical protein KUCAC02_020921, partial [Chaenocephalus aceratus]
VSCVQKRSATYSCSSTMQDISQMSTDEEGLGEGGQNGSVCQVIFKFDFLDVGCSYPSGLSDGIIQLHSNWHSESLT